MSELPLAESDSENLYAASGALEADRLPLANWHVTHYLLMGVNTILGLLCLVASVLGIRDVIAIIGIHGGWDADIWRHVWLVAGVTSFGLMWIAAAVAWLVHRWRIGILLGLLPFAPLFFIWLFS